MRFQHLMTGLFLCMVLHIQSQDLSGAYTSTEDGVVRWLLMNDYCFTWTKYQLEDGEYINTIGGTFTNTSKSIRPTIEFNPHDSTEIGQTLQWSYALDGDELSIRLSEDQDPFVFRKEHSNQQELDGAFLFSGRKRDSEISRRDTDQPRKTLKILVGDRFQWIAYHVTNKKFMGSGGGSYIAKDGKYIENIEFFSRDKSRVGASLEFDYNIIDGDWHHSGKSSKGEPMYEIWSKRKVKVGF